MREAETPPLKTPTLLSLCLTFAVWTARLSLRCSHLVGWHALPQHDVTVRRRGLVMAFGLIRAVIIAAPLLQWVQVPDVVVAL
jgi:hypothetical protein